MSVCSRCISRIRPTPRVSVPLIINYTALYILPIYIYIIYHNISGAQARTLKQSPKCSRRLCLSLRHNASVIDQVILHRDDFCIFILYIFIYMHIHNLVQVQLIMSTMSISLSVQCKCIWKHEHTCSRRSCISVHIPQEDMLRCMVGICCHNAQVIDQVFY